MPVHTLTEREVSEVFKTRITELLGIEYPIIQGGMGWISSAELAASGSNRRAYWGYADHKKNPLRGYWLMGMWKLVWCRVVRWWG